MTRKTFLPMGFSLLASLALPYSGSATTFDGGALAPTTRVEGRVLSTEADPATRTTLVVLGDDAGREVARFRTLGARVGRVQWVADGFPAFTVGEQVEVGLTTSPAGLALAVGTDGAAAARVFAPSATTGVVGPAVTDVEPPAGGAVPHDAELVTVTGTGFGATQGDSHVSFLGIFQRVEAEVISWSDDAIVCRVPAPGLLGTPQVLTGPIKVWTPLGGWSDGDPFANGSSFSVLYQWAGDSWPTARLPIGVWVNPMDSPFGTGLVTAAGEAATRWNVPGAFARFVLRGTTTAEGGNHSDPATPRDGRNTVIWRSTWQYNPAILALTWSSIDTLTLEREEVETEINGTRPWTLDTDVEPAKFDLPSTLTHEFGHWIRLGHTQFVPSVMLAFQNPGDKRRDVSEGDGFGAAWVHPTYGIAAVSGLDVAVTAFDREGRPRPLLARDLVHVRAIPLDENESPDALDPPLLRAPAVDVRALADADDQGRTSAALAGLADGRYRVETHVDGHFVRPASIVRVGAEPVPPSYALGFASVPSPLLPGTHGHVRFTLPRAAQATLDLYDALGRRVRALASGPFAAGPNAVGIEATGTDGRRLGAGVYFLRLAAAGEAATSRVVVLP